MDTLKLTPTREKWLLWTLAAVQFTHIVDFMVMMPLGPQLTQLFHLSDAEFGVLVSSYSLAAGASGLLASLYIDRFDRRRALFGLYAGFALATLACGLAPTYASLLVARIAAGVFGGVLGAMVQTIVGDVIPFERRGQAVGTIMAAFSLSTVAGVPGSLWLADRWSWHVPFFSIAAVSGLLCVVAWRVVPSLSSHVAGQAGQGPWQRLSGVLREPNHWRAFGLSALLVLGSFAIIPYITIFTTTNVGLPSSQVPLVYLIGGVATFFTAHLWGRLADRWGKVQTFRALAVAALVPMVVLTYLGPSPLWVLLLVTTSFFVFVSGRMVPCMALLTAASHPDLRGGFMSINNAVQSTAMGLAAWLGGLMISRSPTGQVVGYERCGWLAAVSTLLMLWWVGRLQVYPSAAEQAPHEDFVKPVAA